LEFGLSILAVDTLECYWRCVLLYWKKFFCKKLV